MATRCTSCNRGSKRCTSRNQTLTLVLSTSSGHVDNNKVNGWLSQTHHGSFQYSKKRVGGACIRSSHRCRVLSLPGIQEKNSLWPTTVLKVEGRKYSSTNPISVVLLLTIVSTIYYRYIYFLPAISRLCCPMLPNVAQCCPMLPNVAQCCSMLLGVEFSTLSNIEQHWATSSNIEQHQATQVSDSRYLLIQIDTR